MKNYFMNDRRIFFQFPIDGDCLNDRDGEPYDFGVNIRARVCAPSDAEITVNGVKAVYENGVFIAPVHIFGYRNTLVAKDLVSGEECKITVLYLQQTVGHYRISSDDNIRFLQDINANKDVYKSIFENPYLAIYKKAHDLYGAKVHLNLFYEFEDKARERFSEPREYFNLSMMTDKFKNEFIENSDWLKLAFHSRCETPGRPYEFASAETIIKDCIDVHREIIRFAGRECISNSTTIHFGEANHECMRALRAMGYRSFTGYFRLHNDVPSVSYYAPKELVEHVNGRDFWYDTDEDILFAKIDRVTNEGPLTECMDEIQRVVSDPHLGGFVSIMIHEQYFYKDYKAYKCDFEARILEPCKLLSGLGYKGAHLTDITCESNLKDFPKFN